MHTGASVKRSRRGEVCTYMYVLLTVLDRYQVHGESVLL